MSYADDGEGHELGRSGAHAVPVSRQRDGCLSSDDDTQAIPATWLRRAVARSIDSVLLAAAVTIVGLAGAFLGLSRDFSGDGFEIYGAFFAVFGHVLMHLQDAVRVSRTGQTIGKAAMGIAVVGADGRCVSRRQSALRVLMPTAAAAAGCAAVLILFFPDGPVSVSFLGVAIYTSWFALPAVWLMSFVVASRHRDRRCWHDRAAGTLVVQRQAEETGNRRFASSAARETAERYLSRNRSGA